MTFPTINHINDVLPHIAGRSEFIVAQRDGYQVIDYNFALDDSFADPIRLECRGIKFAPDGPILARPLHKFFNIGERPETHPHVLDFSQAHDVTEKLDGSMIHAAIVHSEVVFMTRMGRTDVARKAERHLTGTLRAYCAEAIENGCTPIFEFTAPDNRIVVRYEDSSLSLLAIRRMRNGCYLDRMRCVGWARDAHVPLVAYHTSDWKTGQEFHDFARTVTGREGFVVRFADGTWVKAKGEDYVLKHKAKDSILQEKNVLALILSGGLDDVLPLLDEADRGAIERYQADVTRGLTALADDLHRHVEAGSHLDQKTFAVEHQARLLPSARPLAFSVRSGAPAMEVVRRSLAKSIGSQTEVSLSRWMHGAVWPLDAANDNQAAISAAA